MPKKSVTLEIAADASRAERELKKTQRQLNYFKKQATLAGRGSGGIFAPATKGATQLSGSLGVVGSRFKNVATAGVGLGVGLGGAAVGFAVIGEAFQVIDEGVTKLKNLVAETKKLERETGMSTETSSAWIGVATRFGLSSQQLSLSLGLLSKKIVATEGGTKAANKQLAIFAQAGVGRSILASRDMDRILIAVANRFKAMPDGVNKTDLALKLFGRSGKNLIPVLNQGGSRLAALKREMAALGLTINGNTKARVTELTKAQRVLKQVWDGIQIQLATRVIPRLVNFASAARDAAVALRTGRKPAQGLADDLYRIGRALEKVWSLMKKVKEVNDLLQNLDVAGRVLNGPVGKWVADKLMATGGIVSGPTRAIVGEDGPEAVIPLSRKHRARGAALYQAAGAAMGMNGGHTFVVNNYGNQLDETQLAARFAWQLKTRTV